MNHTPEVYADVAIAANAIIEQTFQAGGGTFDFKGNLLPTSCFVVGGAGEKRVWDITDPDIKVKLALYMQSQPRKGFDSDKGLIGTWVQNGILYVDRVTLHETRLDAIVQGFHREQIAIWDGEKQESIHLQGGN